MVIEPLCEPGELKKVRTKFLQGNLYIGGQGMLLHLNNKNLSCTVNTLYQNSQVFIVVLKSNGLFLSKSLYITRPFVSGFRMALV